MDTPVSREILVPIGDVSSGADCREFWPGSYENGLYPPREVKVGETPAEETHDRDRNRS
jgi:hypothetical protein